MVWRQLPKLIPAGSIPVSRSKKTVPNVYVSELFFFPLPPDTAFAFGLFILQAARAQCAGGLHGKARSAKRSAPCFLLSVCYAPMLVRSL